MANLDAGQLALLRMEFNALRFAGVVSRIPDQVADALAKFPLGVLLTGFVAGKRALLFLESWTEAQLLCVLAVEQSEWSSGEDRDRHAEEIRQALVFQQLPSELGMPETRQEALSLRIALAQWIRGEIPGAEEIA